MLPDGADPTGADEPVSGLRSGWCRSGGAIWAARTGAGFGVDRWHIEIPRFGMVRDDGGDGLLRLKLELLAEAQTDAAGLQQLKELHLVLQVRAGGVVFDPRLTR